MPKKLNWSQTYEETANELASPDDYRTAEKALKRKPGDIPAGKTLAALLIWVRARKALAGDDKAAGEVLDRLAPKPVRVKVDTIGGPVRKPVSEMDTPEDRAASDYMFEIGER